MSIIFILSKKKHNQDFSSSDEELIIATQGSQITNLISQDIKKKKNSNDSPSEISNQSTKVPTANVHFQGHLHLWEKQI